jgi:adenosylhomocysteine nucleosidase
MSPPKVAIVAALEREVRPVIKHWRSEERQHDGRRFRFFENDRAVVICGGIGREAARRATEAVIKLYEPTAIISVGFAGALNSKLKVGAPVRVKKVIDATDGSSHDSGSEGLVLITTSEVAGVAQKTKMAKAYSADAIDMEAAAVARGAQQLGLPFTAFKAISDEVNFEMPSMQGFVTSDGRFQTFRFTAFAAMRPWLWPDLIHLARNSARATKTLCEWLDRYNHPAEKLQSSGPELHPIKGTN